MRLGAPCRASKSGWQPYKGRRTDVIVTLANLSCYTFTILNSYAHLEVFLDMDWGNLGVPGKLWMSLFQKAKEIKIPIVGSKVMTSRSMLMHFSRFSQHLNGFNSNPWIVVRMRIWLSLQWCWIKIRVSKAHQESTPGQTWSELLKISKELEFDINHEKCYFVRILALFDLWLTQDWLGTFWSFWLKKGTLSALVS